MDNNLLFTKEDVNLFEIYRYLGIKGTEPEADEPTKMLVFDCLDELMTKIRPKSFHRVFDLAVSDTDDIDLTAFKVHSVSLAKNLRGCDRVILFAATLGDGVDFLIRKYEQIRMSRATVLQAASAAMTETLCNRVNDLLSAQYGREGYRLRHRFSPGYGDFALENQRFFMDTLQMQKTVGIRLTEGYLMLPTKSVTAVIGMEKDEASAV